jgi:hypothetical protein
MRVEVSTFSNGHIVIEMFWIVPFTGTVVPFLSRILMLIVGATGLLIIPYVNVGLKTIYEAA